MTRDEFENAKETLTCQHCGHVGLRGKHYPNNDGMRAECPACLSLSPLPNVQFLPKEELRKPRPRPGDVDDVWTSYGDCCTHCSAGRAFLEHIGIGLTVQHVVPEWKDPDRKSPAVPYCARCHQESSARQQTTRRMESRDDALGQIIRRIEEKFPELRGDLLEP